MPQKIIFFSIKKLSVFSMLPVVALLLFWPCKIHSQTQKKIDSINTIAIDKVLNNRFYYDSLFNKNAADAKKINYDFGLGQSYSNLARLSFYAGKFEKNINYSLEAIRLFEKTNNQEALARELGELGFRMKDRNLKKASSYMQKSIRIAEQYKYPNQLVNLYNNYGVLKKRKQELDSALLYFRKSLSLKEQLKDSIGIPYSLNNIAEIYLERSQFSEAALLFKQALNLRLQLRDQYGIADSYAYLGDLYLQQKRHSQSIEYYQKSIEISRQYKFNTLLLHNYKMITQSYEATNNIEMALNSFKMHVLYKDSIFNQETNAKIAELEVQFQTNEKEKQLLVQQNEVTKTKNKLQLVSIIAAFLVVLGALIYRQQKFKIKQQQQEFQLKNAISKIETQNKLQEQRLSISRDLHDNIGAQLTFIISSIENIKYAFPIQDSNLQKKLSTISTFTKTTILELRDTIWAMNSNEISFEDLKSRIFNFIQKAQFASEEIQFNFTIDPSLTHITLNSVTGMNLYRTIQEALNNAIKHAQAKNISIEINSNKEFIQIIINDNGIGFTETEIEKGNGLNNMKKRIAEINGTINFGRNEQGGTCIEINVKGTNV